MFWTKKYSQRVLLKDKVAADTLDRVSKGFSCEKSYIFIFITFDWKQQ